MQELKVGDAVFSLTFAVYRIFVNYIKGVNIMREEF